MPQSQINCANNISSWWSIRPLRDLKTGAPESGIKGMNKQSHPMVSMGCNYLSLPLIALLAHSIRARGAIKIHTHSIQLWWLVCQKQVSRACPCPWYMFVSHKSSFVIGSIWHVIRGGVGYGLHVILFVLSLWLFPHHSLWIHFFKFYIHIRVFWDI